MGIEETPKIEPVEEVGETKESKESTLSFEEFSQKVNETLELMRTQDLLNPYDVFYGYGRKGGPISKFRGYYAGDPDYYEANLDAVKAYPEFKELIEEEQEIRASGASPQEIAKYNTLAERAYKRKMEVLEPIEQKLKDLEREYAGPGEFIYKAAEILRMASRSGRPVDTELERALLRDKFASLQYSIKSITEREKREKEEDLLQEQFGERYRESLKNVQAALKGQRMLAEMKATGETAQTRGFSSSEEMWLSDIEALHKLKEEVGKDRFEQLEYINRIR